MPLAPAPPLHSVPASSMPAWLAERQGPEAAVTCFAIGPDGQRAVTGHADHALRLWHPSGGDCVRTMRGHRQPVDSVAITPDGRRAHSGSTDLTLRIWDLESGRCLKVITCETTPQATPTGLRGERIVLGAGPGEVVFLDTADATLDARP